MLQKFKLLYSTMSLQKMFVYSFGQLFNLGIPLLIIPYVVKIFGEENFGKTAIGMSVAFFIIVFTDFGSDILGVRQVAINRNNISELNHTVSLNYILRLCILMIFLAVFTLLFLQVPYFRADKMLF